MAAGREPKQSLELFDTCQGLLLPVGSVPINIFHILRQEKSDAIKHPVGWLSLPEAARAVLFSSLPCPALCVSHCLVTSRSAEQIWGLEVSVHSSGQNPVLGGFILEYNP